MKNSYNTETFKADLADILNKNNVDKNLGIDNEILTNFIMDVFDTIYHRSRFEDTIKISEKTFIDKKIPIKLSSHQLTILYDIYKGFNYFKGVELDDIIEYGFVEQYETGHGMHVRHRLTNLGKDYMEDYIKKSCYMELNKDE